ncbi:MAG TPA: hypothetical protein VMP01_22425 [Pirellulaceae bacterium]|nr:hypothetical protein [Pirellulaceae bacterium]
MLKSFASFRLTSYAFSAIRATNGDESPQSKSTPPVAGSPLLK